MVVHEYIFGPYCKVHIKLFVCTFCCFKQLSIYKAVSSVSAQHWVLKHKKFLAVAWRVAIRFVEEEDHDG